VNSPLNELEEYVQGLTKKATPAVGNSQSSAESSQSGQSGQSEALYTSFLFWNSGNITLTGFEAKYAICDLVSSLATFPRESELRPTYFFSDSFCNFQHIY
jgi:hypothetical protein